MKHKRGEAGTNIAALILLIALFILLFMAFIPVDLREQLLPGSSRGSTNQVNDRGVEITGEEKVLLSASPGRVSPFEEVTSIKRFTPVLLFSRLEKEIIDISTTISLEKNLFTESDRIFEFSLNNKESIEKLDLLFFIVEGSGNIKVELNGEIVFEDSLESSKIPISLPVNNLKDKNKLRFISTKGFFGDGYKLNEIKLIVNRRSENKMAFRDFSVTDDEKDGLEDVILSYFVNCLSLQEQGTLTINLNNRLLFSDFVFCDSGINTIDISPDRIKPGLNRLEFKIDKGDYQLDDVEMELNIGEKEFPKYNFEVEDDEFDRIIGRCEVGFDRCIRECDFDCRSDVCFDRCTEDCEIDFGCEKEFDVILRIDFEGERKDTRKRAKITINEETVSFDVVDSFYERDISGFIRRGDNIIKIIPRDSFEIRLMRVFLDRGRATRFNEIDTLRSS